LRAEVDELKAALARRRLEEAKYSPDQPRVPKRNPGGGQFTRIGGGIAVTIGQYRAPMATSMSAISPGPATVGGLFNIAPDDTGADSGNLSGLHRKNCSDDSERRYSVDLREEEARGGHTLRDHVGKTDGYLIG